MTTEGLQERFGLSLLSQLLSGDSRLRYCLFIGVPVGNGDPPMVAANSTMAGAFEFIKEIMGTACVHNGDEHPTPPQSKRMSSGPTSDESTTT